MTSQMNGRFASV